MTTSTNLRESKLYKVSEEINHYTGKSVFIGMTFDGEEITDYCDSYSDAFEALVKELG